MATPIPSIFIYPTNGQARCVHSANLSHGAILFDVDETILNVTADRIRHRRLEQTLADSPTQPVLAELLIAGFRLCAITGNGHDQFEQRFIGPLRTELERQGQLAAMANLEVYANGAATHITFDANGAVIHDERYNRLARIPSDDHDIIVQVLTEAAERAATHRLAPQVLGREYDLGVWAYAWDEGSGRWHAEEAGHLKAVPYVVSRGDRVQVTLKPLPSQKHILRKGQPDLREQVLQEVRAELEVRLGDRFRRYQVQVGGWSSIDVTRGITKATAVEHYLAMHQLEPEEVLYMGNEFRPDGNDQPVIQAIPGIQAICVNQPPEQVFYLSNVVWGGSRGVLSAEHHLMEVLERFGSATLARDLDPDSPAVPVIRELQVDGYLRKIRERQRLLDRLAAPTDPVQLMVLRETVCLLDRALRSLMGPMAEAPSASQPNVAQRPAPAPLLQ